MNNAEYKSYEEMKIEILQNTVDPALLITRACNITQKQNTSNDKSYIDTCKLIKYLFTANHTSPFEHAVITVLISNVSRSFLAQITRHRMGSFTSASQHYTIYSGFPNILHPEMLTMESVYNTIKAADQLYQILVDEGVPKEEARQVLPNAKAVNIMWTVNARSLVNFFNQRLCRRNVIEMRAFAVRLQKVCIHWFPELFMHVGPDCKTLGGCTQGYMKATYCKNNYVEDFKK